MKKFLKVTTLVSVTFIAAYVAGLYLAEVLEDMIFPSETSIGHVHPKAEPINEKLYSEPPKQQELKKPDPAAGPEYKEKILVLDVKNTLAFRDVVTERSMADLQKKMLKMSNSLPKNAVIYLVLDTPGGSIAAGNNFIDSAKALPQRVKTITLFAASMGFHMAQALDERLILPSGVLMSHRASIRGLAGQVPGEANVRLNHITNTVLKMDIMAAKRMSMDVEEYRKLILNEYWVDGQDAVDQKASDEVVLVRCSKELSESSYKADIDTFFGTVSVEWSGCPLITYPLKVNAQNFNLGLMEGPNKPEDVKKKQEAKEYVDRLINDRPGFVKEFIVTNKYEEVILGR